MSVNYTKNLEIGMEYLQKQGAFLTVKNSGVVNTMTIGWGSTGFVWRKPVFTVLVRESRYTYDLIDKCDEFTISIPLSSKLKSALAYCGTKSGRDVNKFKECGILQVPAKKISTPVIDGCGLYYECKIIYKTDIIPDLLDRDIKNSVYSDNDYHKLFFGEIIDCYEK